LTLEEERTRLRRAKQFLEDQAQSEVLGFGAPAADVSEHTLQLLMDEGFLYDRSFLDSDFPYAFSNGRQRIVELPIAWTLDDFTFFGHNVIPKLGWGIREPRDVMELWRGEFEAFDGHGGFACFVLHPEVIGRWSRLDPFRSLLGDLVEMRAFSTCRSVARRFVNGNTAEEARSVPFETSTSPRERLQR
jgi:hypothetical protein